MTAQYIVCSKLSSLFAGRIKIEPKMWELFKRLNFLFILCPADLSTDPFVEQPVMICQWLRAFNISSVHSTQRWKCQSVSSVCFCNRILTARTPKSQRVWVVTNVPLSSGASSFKIGNKSEIHCRKIQKSLKKAAMERRRRWRPIW